MTTELQIFGWKQEDKYYHNVMINTWNETNKSNVEQLLIDPIAAIEYCERVRMYTKTWVPYPEILQRLVNLRKRKAVK